jgi:diacylglycerol diphosphate phosphatase/phosphatidate phosphatase
MIVSLSQDFALYLISFLAPLVLQWIINLLTIRTLWDAHNSALGRKTRRSEDVDVLLIKPLGYSVMLSLSLTGAITQVVKITVGRPRPGDSRTLLTYAALMTDAPILRRSY